MTPLVTLRRTQEAQFDFCRALHAFHQEGLFCNVDIVCQDGDGASSTVSCNSLVVASASRTLASAIRAGGTDENGSAVVLLLGFGNAEVRDLVDCLYEALTWRSDLCCSASLAEALGLSLRTAVTHGHERGGDGTVTKVEGELQQQQQAKVTPVPSKPVVVTAPRKVVPVATKRKIFVVIGRKKSSLTAVKRRRMSIDHDHDYQPSGKQAPVPAVAAAVKEPPEPEEPEPILPTAREIKYTDFCSVDRIREVVTASGGGDGGRFVANLGKSLQTFIATKKESASAPSSAKNKQLLVTEFMCLAAVRCSGSDDEAVLHFRPLAWPVQSADEMAAQHVDVCESARAVFGLSDVDLYFQPSLALKMNRGGCQREIAMSRKILGRHIHRETRGELEKVLEKGFVPDMFKTSERKPQLRLEQKNIVLELRQNLLAGEQEGIVLLRFIQRHHDESDDSQPYQCTFHVFKHRDGAAAAAGEDRRENAMVRLLANIWYPQPKLARQLLFQLDPMPDCPSITERHPKALEAVLTKQVLEKLLESAEGEFPRHVKRCPVCEEPFRGWADRGRGLFRHQGYVQHVASHGIPVPESRKSAKRGNFDCPLCDQKFQDVSPNKWIRHYMLCHYYQKHKCDCDREFATMSEKIDHVRMAHKDCSRCPICLLVFKNERAALHVRKRHFGEKVCGACGEEVGPGAEGLAKHILSAHADELRREVVEKPRPPESRCEQCGEIVANAEEHFKRRHRSVGCKKCGKTFTGQHQLMRHDETEHASSKTCRKCNETFPDARSYKQHQQSKHRNMHERTCKDCGCAVLAKDMFRHRHAMHGVAQICSFCGKECPSEHALKNHEETHQIRTCDECGETFVGKARLKNHKHVAHHKGSSLQCEACGAEAPNKRAMVNHKANYHAQRSCGLCEKVFEGFVSYARHRKFCGIAEEEAVKCPHCDGVLANEVSLRLHVANLHKEMTCDVCQDTLTGSAALGKHYREIHPGVTRKKLKWKKPKPEPGDRTYCGDCQKDFPAHLFEKHRRAQHTQHDCDACGQTFDNMPKLRSHKMRAHPKVSAPEEAITCEMCGKVTPNKRSYSNHTQNAHREIKCPDCGEVIVGALSFQTHKKRHEAAGC